jgi:hypothetical protein
MAEQGPSEITPIEEWVKHLEVSLGIEFTDEQTTKTEGVVGDVIREALQVAGYVCLQIGQANATQAAELNAKGEYPFHTARFTGAAEVAEAMGKTLMEAGEGVKNASGD